MAGEEAPAIFMLGRSAELGSALIPKWQDEFDVVHFCTTPAAAKAELPASARGEPVLADKPIGTNSQRIAYGRAPRRPVAVFVGAGFSDDAYEDVRRELAGVVLEFGLVWVRETRADTGGLLEDEENWIMVAGERRPRVEVLDGSVRKAIRRGLEGLAR
ncbi:hypothetical protein K431DRAFT_283855 [Polychaeton citri CBS 116435]|uniref:Uncharacterized protein n=1 Tax=Polychaeton citri CBS 116435 TaxID=1314669 RepID=A0A9P4QAJ1_9PEZI|nr:hypothetical protein K431DRAFT_283855 [Polychaeton citri CBS 116435]